MFTSHSQDNHPIKRIKVYQCDLPLKEKSYNWSQGKSISVFDSTIVSVETTTGYIGYGEVTPLGSYYLPSYAKGVRSGLDELCPLLIGQNSINLLQLNEYMDYYLKGHPYIKSPIDIACWDILGKHCKLPLCNLLGGRFGESIELYRAISQQSNINDMLDNIKKYQLEDDYKKFQLKSGSKNIYNDIGIIHLLYKKNIIQEYEHILVADANTGWLPHECLRIINSVKKYSNLYIEEPCATYEQNLLIRKRHNTTLPLVLDECIDSIYSLMKCINDKAADVINLKISKLGGLTKAKEVRDLCVRNGIAMTIEDTWGGDIVTATIAHLAHSTPEKYRFSSTDFNSYCSISNAHGSPQKIHGKMKASYDYGLGIQPIMDVLGNPVAVYE